jgi:hypothetical protein
MPSMLDAVGDILAFVWRTYVSNHSNSQRRPPYHITSKQNMQLQKINGIVRSETEHDHEEDRFDQLDMDNKNDKKRLIDAQTQALENHVLVDYISKDNEYTRAS